MNFEKHSVSVLGMICGAIFFIGFFFLLIFIFTSVKGIPQIG